MFAATRPRAEQLKRALAAAGDIAKAHGTGADRFSVKRAIAAKIPAPTEPYCHQS
jgi:hypothetical protein